MPPDANPGCPQSPQPWAFTPSRVRFAMNAAPFATRRSSLCEGGDGAVRDTPAPSYNPRFPSQ